MSISPETKSPSPPGPAVRRKRSKAEREEFVTRWRASGTSVREFAAEHDVASSSMYQWIRAQKSAVAKKGGKHKRKTKVNEPKAKPTFTELSIVGQAVPVDTRGPTMTVALRGGHTVTLEGMAVDPTWLASVLKVVSAC